jgi:hypothetical protein
MQPTTIAANDSPGSRAAVKVVSCLHSPTFREGGFSETGLRCMGFSELWHIYLERLGHDPGRAAVLCQGATLLSSTASKRSQLRARVLIGAPVFCLAPPTSHRMITEARIAEVAVVLALMNALTKSSLSPLFSGTRSVMNRSATERVRAIPIPVARRVSKRCCVWSSIELPSLGSV